MYSILIVIAAGVAAADQPANGTVADERLIQGRWEYVSVQFDGNPFPLEKGDHIVITGHNWSIHRNKTVIKAEHAFDPSKTPKQLDLVVKKDDATVRLKGIYKLEGKMLTICEPPSATSPRPTTFSAEEGEKQFLIVLKRSIANEK
jgi:uncharacterized protein (TIGR03067 family)